MDFNKYTQIKIDEIRLKQFEHDSLNAMLVRYDSELNTQYQKILTENQIPVDYLQQKVESCASVDVGCEPIDTNYTTVGEYDDICSALFKILALVTHPDKNVDDNNDFLLIHAAYENKDVFTLLEYGVKYNVRADSIDNNVMMVILEKKMNKIVQKIDKIKTLVSYHLLIHGQVDSHIDGLKRLIKMEAENKEYAERNKKLEEMLKNK